MKPLRTDSDPPGLSDLTELLCFPDQAPTGSMAADFSGDQSALSSLSNVIESETEGVSSPSTRFDKVQGEGLDGKPR